MLARLNKYWLAYPHPQLSTDSLPRATWKEEKLILLSSILIVISGCLLFDTTTDFFLKIHKTNIKTEFLFWVVYTNYV